MLSLNAAQLPKLDAELEKITEGEGLTKKEKLKTKWDALEGLVGDVLCLRLGCGMASILPAARFLTSLLRTLYGKTGLKPL